MDLDRILAEAGRQLKRSWTLWLPVTWMAPAILLAILEPEEGLDALLHLLFLVMPLSLAPLATHLVSRDLSDGSATLVQVASVEPGEAFLARVLALSGILLFSLVGVLPVAVAAASVAPSTAVIQMAPYLALGALTGLAALSWGLLIPALVPEHPRRALSLSFGLVILWLLLGMNDGSLARPPGTSGWAGLNALVGLSPYTWARGVDGSGVLIEGPTSLASVLLIIGLCVLAASWIIGVHGRGSIRGMRSRIAKAWMLSAFGLLLVPLLLAGFVPVSENAQVSDPGSGVHERGDLCFTTFMIPDRLGEATVMTWKERVRMRLDLTVLGPPEEPLTLNAMTLEGEGLHFSLEEPRLPTDVSLTEVREDDLGECREDGSRIGVASATFFLVMEPQRLTEDRPLVTAHLEFEDRAVAVPIELSQRWELPSQTVGPVGAFSVVGFWLAAKRLPHRWNEW